MKDSQDPSSKDFAFQAVFRLTLQMFTAARVAAYWLNKRLRSLCNHERVELQTSFLLHAMHAVT